MEMRWKEEEEGEEEVYRGEEGSLLCCFLDSLVLLSPKVVLHVLYHLSKLLYAKL